MLPFAYLFFAIKMNYRIAMGSRDKEQLAPRHSVNELGRERDRVLWIFWSVCLTPLRFLMDHTICSVHQTYESPCICVSRRRRRRRS